MDQMVTENTFYEVVTTQVRPFGISRLAVVRNDSLCAVDEIPSLPVYFSAINAYGVSLFTLGGAAVLLILILFIDTLKYVMKNSPPRVKTHSAFVLGVYPVVAIATYCAIVVPRANLLAEAVTQGIFMAGMYQLFCLFVAYCGGEAELIKRVKPQSLETKVGPCCCWPCCCCLPQLTLDKNNVKFLRLLVLQLPVVQGLVYMALLVMWAERESLYHVNYMYVQPLIVFSILSGIWGMSMTMRMLRDILKDHSMMGKFIVLQLVLLFAKLQGLVMRTVVWSGALPCKMPVTPTVYGNLIYSCLMLIEMVILQIIARRLYKRDLPKSFENNNNIEPVCIISSHVSTIENIMKGTINCSPSAVKINKDMAELQQSSPA